MIQESADVDPSAIISASARIWHLAQVREYAVIGDHVVIGRGAYIGVGVSIGDSSKIQNGAQIYEPAVLEQGVFIGPGAVLTNDRVPRSTDLAFQPKKASGWDAVGVLVEAGASLGAGCVCVAPIRIGRWSMVAAGSTVIKDVPRHALVAGNPAKFIGWISEEGERLVRVGTSDAEWHSESTGRRYTLGAEGLVSHL